MSHTPCIGILGVIGIFASMPLGGLAETDEGSGWTLTAGAQVRRIDVGFQVDAPEPMSWGRLYARHGDSGPGDVGVATSGSDFITYLDGTVGVNQHPVRDRDTSFSVASVSQVVFGTQGPGADFPTIGEVTFHSARTGYDYEEHYRADPFSVEASEVVVSPFIELQRNLFEQVGLFVDLVVGWSYLESQHGTGTRTVATQTLAESRTDSRYTYLYDLPSAVAPAGFPPVYSNTVLNGVIYDAADFNAFGGFSPGDDEYVRNPRTLESHRTSDRLVAVLTAESSATLDVDAHVIPILLEARCQISPRIFLAAGAGPTLNVISHDFGSRTDWYLNGSPLSTERESDDGTELVVGATVRAALSVILSDDGTLLLEAGGGYDWVPTQTVSTGNARADFDLSSWIGTLGLCKHF